MTAILITGAREWTDIGAIQRVFEFNKQFNPMIIHGDCKGADRMAGVVAASLGLAVKACPANWALGRCAGVIRNGTMIADLLELRRIGYQVCVFAFHNALSESKGTKDCVNKALKAGLPVYLVSSTETKIITSKV